MLFTRLATCNAGIAPYNTAHTVLRMYNVLGSTSPKIKLVPKLRGIEFSLRSAVIYLVL